MVHRLQDLRHGGFRRVLEGPLQGLQRLRNGDMAAFVVLRRERPVMTAIGSGLLHVDQFREGAELPKPFAVVQIRPGEAVMHAGLVTHVDGEAHVHAAAALVGLHQEPLGLLQRPGDLAGNIHLLVVERGEAVLRRVVRQLAELLDDAVPGRRHGLCRFQRLHGEGVPMSAQTRAFQGLANGVALANPLAHTGAHPLVAVA